MLKPKRKITREEIKKDSFVESVFKTRSFVRDNSKLFYRIGGGCAILFTLVIFFGISLKNNKQEAEFLLTQSTLYLDGGDKQNAKIILQELVDEYGGTEPGRLGGYHLAQIHIKDYNNDSALPLLIEYSENGDNPFLLSSVNESISNIYLQNNDLKNAIKYQSNSVKKTDTKKATALSKVKLAELYIKEGSFDKSSELIYDLSTEYSDDTDIMNKINYLLGLSMNN